MSDDPPQLPSVEVIFPTDEERQRVRAQVERYASYWQSTPAFLKVKPRLGLIVSLNKIEYHQHDFGLEVTVDEVLVAPETFDAPPNFFEPSRITR